MSINIEGFFLCMSYNVAYLNIFMVVTSNIEGSMKFFFDLGNKGWHATD